MPIISFWVWFKLDFSNLVEIYEGSYRAKITKFTDILRDPQGFHVSLGIPVCPQG